ncbi:MAG: peptide chain release factor 1 [Brachybacterium sp.]|uniref:peptide chain release factor 1 n=1 Tax=Brachybacterium sp. TaxID=1891286 RepID=UPI00264AEE1D|nr:peptide chain release factor 1 [Brachybacterium sp.]MDN6301801.1 peptide chain release factor 1 [Brachybacterium sp.]MDN6328087.1 peptide chain release factor 1 [Brachybacterium sp.]
MSEHDGGDRLAPLREEHARLQESMADPALHEDAARARRVGRRYAELEGVLDAAVRLEATTADLETARELEELGEGDEELAAEAEQLYSRLTREREQLEDLLAPRDPDDARDVILEIKAGAGGEESALFAAEMLRMYRAFAESQGWRVEVLTSAESDLGGLKDVTVAIASRGAGGPGTGVYAHLKYEAGVHRVQRVPVTESQGRIHTSAVGVLVLPEADEADESELLAEAMAPANLRIDVFRSSGPGGQSVNTTDSAVRITHVPTGVVVSCQDQKSQLQNREQALRILRTRLLDARRAEQEAQSSATRRSQVRTVDRSERIRTYNFPESRVADHRTGFKAGNLAQVLAGDLADLIASSREAERAARLAAAQAGTDEERI